MVATLTTDRCYPPQTLSQHEKSDQEEYRLLSYFLLFKTNQHTEACTQILSWLRDEPKLSWQSARDAVGLLIEREAHAAALQACDVVLDRLRRMCSAGADGLAPARDQYSDVVELKFHLLADIVPDSAAKADHVEAILDGHVNQSFPLTPLTLST